MFAFTEEIIRYWSKQAEQDDGLRSDGLTTAEKEEIVVALTLNQDISCTC